MKLIGVVANPTYFLVLERRTGSFNFYCPQSSWGKVIFSEACVKNSVHMGEGACMAGGMCGRGVDGRGACVAGRHVWQGWHAWQGCVGGGWHAWQGVCMAGGACVVGGVRGGGILLECILVHAKIINVSFFVLFFLTSQQKKLFHAVNLSRLNKS